MRQGDQSGEDREIREIREKTDQRTAGIRGLIDAAIILSWFAVSRLIAVAIGVAPDRAAPEIFWQLLPLDLLENRLLESLWYLHSQPPLFNAFVGALLKLPGDYIMWWRAAWLVLGFGFPLATFFCLRIAGAHRVVAHLLTLGMCLNPTLLLYENFLLYSYPEALLVLLAFGALLVAPHAPKGWVWFAVIASTLALLRATFQPVWAIGVAAVVAWSVSGRLRRAEWFALFAPALIGLLLAGRNGLLFDVWTSSSWYGMNVAKLSVTAMLGETPRLVQLGVVSQVFAAGPFQPASRYPSSMVHRAAAEAKSKFGDVPALTVEYKANGQPNFNHLVYRDVSRQLLIESAAAARARPALFDETVAKGLWYYVQPASFYVFLSDNRRRVEGLDNGYFNLLYPGGTFLVVRLLLLVAMCASGAVALFDIRRLAELRPAAAYVFVTALWVTVTSNLAEYGENMRLRFAIDPLLTVWCLVLIVWVAGLTASAKATAVGQMRD